jgi:hypothetical protein
MAGSESDLKMLLRRVVELVMPNLRHYYRVPRKGRIVKSYSAAGGLYFADVQPLRNDESVDEREPVLPRIEIPILWGGPDRGVVCPPTPGTLCDITYYDGDPNYPRISNFRWEKNRAPACELGAFVIQQSPGTFIKIDKDGIAWIEAATIHLNGVEGGKVVTTKHKCHYTGYDHGDGSSTVTAEQ